MIESGPGLPSENFTCSTKAYRELCFLRQDVTVLLCSHWLTWYLLGSQHWFQTDENAPALPFQMLGLQVWVFVGFVCFGFVCFGVCHRISLYYVSCLDLLALMAPSAPASQLIQQEEHRLPISPASTEAPPSSAPPQKDVFTVINDPAYSRLSYRLWAGQTYLHVSSVIASPAHFHCQQMFLKILCLSIALSLLTLTATKLSS